MTTHTIKVGNADVEISSARLVRHAERMHRWPAEKRADAHERAEFRLRHSKQPRKRDAAIAIASRGPIIVGNG